VWFVPYLHGDVGDRLVNLFDVRSWHATDLVGPKREIPLRQRGTSNQAGDVKGRGCTPTSGTPVHMFDTPAEEEESETFPIPMGCKSRMREDVRTVPDHAMPQTFRAMADGRSATLWNQIERATGPRC
jgi:hypothetical protein